MKRTIAILLSAVLILPLLGCNKTQDNIPQLLRDLGVKITSTTTQQLNYWLWGSSDTVTRQLIDYNTKDGDTFCFDEAGNLISFRTAEPDRAAQTAGFSVNQITREYIVSLLSVYVPDLDEFEFSEAPFSTEYGYDVMLYKNVDTVCEDCIVLRLGLGGELRSFNISRSGISDPAEVDTAYFSDQLASVLDEISDEMVSYEVGYQKVNGIIVATFSVEFEDPYGGRYVNVYMVANASDAE